MGAPSPKGEGWGEVLKKFTKNPLYVIAIQPQAGKAIPHKETDCFTSCLPAGMAFAMTFNYGF